MSSPLSAEPRLGLDLVPLDSFAAYLAYRRDTRAELDRRRRFERELVAGGGPVDLEIACWSCGSRMTCRVDPGFSRRIDGRPDPLWREQLVCPRCMMSARMRAALHLFHEICQPSLEDALYVTEQTTGIHAWLAGNFPNLIGSEFLGHSIPLGLCDAWGTRNEDLEGLTLSPASVDFVLCFDVFEHVDDHRKALAECARVLRADGSLFFTVPLQARARRNQHRAELDRATGRVRHLLEPELHHDQRNPAGALAFHTFGWELLDEVRDAGFSEVVGYVYWSAEYGYLGDDLLVFVAHKREPRPAPAPRDDPERLAETRQRAAWEEVTERLRGELERFASPPPGAPDPTGGREVRSAEAAATARRLALTTARLERAYATNTGLAQQVMGERSRLGVEIAALEQERARLASAVGALEQARSALEARLGGAEGNLAAAAEERARLDARAAALEAEGAELGRRLEGAAAERDRLGGRIGELTGEAEALAAALAGARREQAATAERLAGHETRLAELEARLAEICGSRMWRLWTGWHRLRGLLLRPLRRG